MTAHIRIGEGISAEYAPPFDDYALAQLTYRARQIGADVARGIGFATELAVCLPMPRAGRTAQRFAALSAVAAGDLTVARILEPHADALAILDEAGVPSATGSWGVFAAQRSGVTLEATRSAEGWILIGTKPWCSLGMELDHCLLTAETPTGLRLFAVHLRDGSVRAAQSEHWVSRGLADIISVSLHFDRTRATPIGDPGWYLSRPGFSWGGIGVAACWLGGARELMNTLKRSAETAHGSSRLVAALALGQVDVQLSTAQTALEAAAAQIDCGEATGRGGVLLAMRVRAAVAAAAEQTLAAVGRYLGPAALAFDEEHARRVVDLGVYIRQHHGERDLITLGETLLGS